MGRDALPFRHRVMDGVVYGAAVVSFPFRMPRPKIPLVVDSLDPPHQKPAFSRIFPPSGATAGNFTACREGGRTDSPKLAKTCRFSPLGFHPGEPGKRRPPPRRMTGQGGTRATGADRFTGMDGEPRTRFPPLLNFSSGPEVAQWDFFQPSINLRNPLV